MRSDAILLMRAVAAAARETPFDRYGDSTPRGYYGDLLGQPGRAQEQAVMTRLNYARDVLEFAGVDAQDRDVLEAGSGFGLGLSAFACLGARATGVELVRWQVDWFRAVIDRLPVELAGRLEAHAGTATDLPIESESVDVVLSLEAISHYYDYRPFLAEARRVLRPGGVLIVSDGNNELNPRVRRHNETIWAAHEQDPRSYVHDPADGDYNPWLLVEHRRRIILGAGGVGEDESWELALETSGMVRNEILAAVGRYVANGERPGRPYRRGTLTVHPDQEIVLERLFNPWELRQEIEGYGFQARVQGHWAGASGKRLHRAADRVLRKLSPVTMRTARGFRIAAYRTSGRD